MRKMFASNSMSGLREYAKNTNTRPKLFNSDLFDVISFNWVFCEQVGKTNNFLKKTQTVWVKQVRKEKQAKI